MSTENHTWREPPTARTWVFLSGLLVIATAALVVMVWLWDAPWPQRLLWPVCLLIWIGLFVSYVRPRSTVQVGPEGWTVRRVTVLGGRTTQVPGEDVWAVRSTADRLGPALVLERNDGSTVPLPAGFPRELADAWTGAQQRADLPGRASES